MQNLLRAAIHESGHLFVTCAQGYSCRRILIEESGDGSSTIDYGEDTILATAIIGVESLAELYDMLSPETKAKSGFVACNLCNILVAGAVAESIYNNSDINADNMISVELSGPDLLRAESLCRNFGVDLNECLGNVHGMLVQSESWKLVTEFASLLVERRQLEGSEIDDEIQKLLE